MKRLLGLSLPVVLLFMSCKKDADTDPAPTLPVVISPEVSFQLAHYGLEQLNTGGDGITAIILRKVPAGRTFSYEITAANGLKTATDSIIKGKGKTVAGDTKIEIEQYSLSKFKDGNLYITVELDSTGEIGKDTLIKDEYVVRTYADMQKMLYSFADNYPDQPYVQVQDIVCPDANTNNAVEIDFTGIYDGQNYKITNFNYTSSASSGSTGVAEFPGLFKSLSSGAIVKNIRLEMSADGIRSGKIVSDGGGIAGTINNSSIINCSVTGNITGNITASSWSSMGGIVGIMQNSNITGCSHSGNITASRVGGIAGSGHSSTIRMSYKTGTLNATGNAGSFMATAIGGLDNTPVKIYDSYVYLSSVQSYSFYALYQAGTPTVAGDYNNCFTNTASNNTGSATEQEGVTLYTGIAELNNHLSGISITGLPDGIAAPANNKPYKAAADANQPMILWWQ